MKPINLIIDTDLTNETDDIFALCYALASKEFNIQLLSLAPYSVSYKRVGFYDGLVDSEMEAKRILMKFGMKNFGIISRGCTSFMPEKGCSSSDASERIIEIAKKNRRTTVLCIGPLTNLATALTLDPTIAKKLDVVFLGTQHIFNEKFTDTNYVHDKRAFEIVVKSAVNLTIIPSPLTKQIVTSTFEAKAHFGSNKVAKYLHTVLNSSVFKDSCRGIKMIQDVGAVAYLLHKHWFKSTPLAANKLLKEQKKTSADRTVNYVYEINVRAEIWLDFLDRINAITPLPPTKK